MHVKKKTTKYEQREVNIICEKQQAGVKQVPEVRLKHGQLSRSSSLRQPGDWRAVNEFEFGNNTLNIQPSVGK